MSERVEELLIGIDIGGTNTKYGLVNRNGEILVRGELDTLNFADVKTYVKALRQEIYGRLLSLGSGYVVKGMGVGAPNGNYYTGEITYAPNLPWVIPIPLAALLEEAFEVPCKLTNDANAAAMGEMMYGAAKNVKHFIIITLGTGVGSGIFTNGELLYGDDGFAGELGHVTVRPGGRVHWGTGKYGSLEAYCSATGIAITAKKMRA